MEKAQETGCRTPPSMADPSTRRRAVLRAAGLTAALTGLAGCNTLGDDDTSTPDDPDVVETDARTTATPTVAAERPTETTATETDDPRTETETTPRPDLEPLEADGSSTVYPVLNQAAAYWNANPPADDAEYWPHAEFGIETDANLADYWAGKYGFPPGERSEPAFPFVVGLSNSGTGLQRLASGAVDIGNASATAEQTVPDRAAADRFTDHVVGVDAVSVVVSAALADEGVTELTGEDLAAIYTGEITNWSAAGGPDREIEVYGRPAGSGTRTAFEAALLDGPDAATTPDDTFGQSQQLAQEVAESAAAIGYLGLAFVGVDGVEPVDLSWRGTTYSYEDEGAGYGATDYPFSRDLHAYTWDGTSEKEAAVLRLVLSAFGQETFVAGSGYVTLPESRRRAQRETLPPTVDDGTGTPTAGTPGD